MSANLPIGPAFSPEVLKHTTPVIPEHLHGWIAFQRKEALEGGFVWDKEEKKMVHDGRGLEAVKGTLRSINNSLKTETRANVIEVLNYQRVIMESRLQHYEGVIYILDQNLK